MKTQETNQTQKIRREPTTVALCAKEIRKILKKEFPKIKFKVTSQNFSMGNSVHVSWEDSVTKEQVEKHIRHFQYGHFNGMIDLYEHSNCREDIPQTKYLSCDRTLTEETVKKFAEEFIKENQLNEPTEDLTRSFEYNGMFYNWFQLAWKELYDKDLSKN